MEDIMGEKMLNVLVIIADRDYPQLYLVSMTEKEFEEVTDAHMDVFGYCREDSSVNKLAVAITDNEKWSRQNAEEMKIPLEWCCRFKDRKRYFDKEDLPNGCKIIFYTQID
jgi:hypothetical protein